MSQKRARKFRMIVGIDNKEREFRYSDKKEAYVESNVKEKVLRDMFGNVVYTYITKTLTLNPNSKRTMYQDLKKWYNNRRKNN